MARKSGKGGAAAVESLFDLNAQNVWTVEARRIASLWRKEAPKEGFAQSEEKLLGVIRNAFEVAHYSKDDAKARKTYENGEWTTFNRHAPKGERIAIRQRSIKRLSDLNAGNISRISVATLLELIDRNFGGGWEAIPDNTRAIIESAFDISTLQLPTARIHATGGTYKKKISEGFEALEIVKGTWTEAIFARKKDLSLLEAQQEEEDDYDEPDDTEETDDDYDEHTEEETDSYVDEQDEQEDDTPEEDYTADDPFYNSYMDEDEQLAEEQQTDDEADYMIEEP
ncbi:MAG: hypothetical protein LUC86_07095 [Prevotellaceae bacterium]|nr:hypothetical protein [Prevotellaceae bacterium]